MKRRTGLMMEGEDNHRVAAVIIIQGELKVKVICKSLLNKMQFNTGKLISTTTYFSLNPNQNKNLKQFNNGKSLFANFRTADFVANNGIEGAACKNP